jgi:hypothetical protein
MNSDCKMIFEGYVDGITRKKRELTGSLMDIIRYGIPEEKQIPALKNRLKEQFAAVKNGVRLSTDEIEEGRRIMGKLRAAGMSRQDLENLYKQAGKVEKEAEFTAQDFVKDSEKHNDIPGHEENAEHEPHGYPQGMTAIQNTLMNVLKKHGFKLNKIHHADKETDAYPTVFMVRKSGPMHNVAEIDGMGAINGEHYDKYVADLKDEAALDELHGRGEAAHYAHKEEDAEDSAEDKMRDRENAGDEKRRDVGVSAAFHYDPMPGLEKTANQIRDLLHGAANDEARTEHIIKMAQTILGDPTEYDKNEYRKMLDGLIVLLNRFIVVPMN